MDLETIQFGTTTAALLRLDEDEIASAPADLGLPTSRPVLVVVGGAGGMTEQQTAATAAVFKQIIVPFVEGHGLAVVDGGTDYGVMQAIGGARAALNASFPLIGVVVEAIVRRKTAECGYFPPDLLEPNHSHFVFTPGSSWGDEAPFISRLATQLAGGEASLTLLINGGDIALEDAAYSVEAGRSVLVFEGSGRTADAIAQTTTGHRVDRRALKLVTTGLVRVVNPYREPDRLRAELDKHFPV
jgi:TRPM family ion channel